VIKLGEKITPTLEATALVEIEKIGQDMKEILNSFDQFDSEFQKFITYLM
jgi:hypothetical protein